MSTAATTTEWELRLKDYVSAGLNKLSQYASGSQKKLQEVAKGLDNVSHSCITSDKKLKEVANDFNKVSLATASATMTWKDFVKPRMGPYMKELGSHGEAIKKISQEWKEYKAVTDSIKPPAISRPGGGHGGHGFGGGSKYDQFMQSAAMVPGAYMPSMMLGGGGTMFAAAAGVLAVGSAMYKGGQIAYDYETAMAKVNGTAQLEKDSLGKLKDRLVDIGSHSGGNFELIPLAYEKILSQTNKVNLSLDILETAVKGAKAGFADIDTLAASVGQSLSSIGEQNASAAEVLDTFMMAKKVGAGEFKDFAQYLPQLIASGKNLAVSYKDTAGMFAYMTGKGQSATDSAMLMENAFTALQKNQVLKGLEKKGISLFDSKGMRKNIGEVFLDLTKRLDGMNDRKKSQFFIDIGLMDAQAKTAFSVLTSDAEKLRSIMGDVNSAFGETDRQLALTANTARNWGDIWDKVKSWGLAIGDVLLPIVDWIVKRIEGAIDLFSKVFSNWGDQKRDNFLNETNVKLADEAASKLTKQKFGVDIKDGGAHSESQMNFYKANAQMFYEKMSGGNKNNIDKKESAAALALKNINAGKPALSSSGGSSGMSGANLSGDGNKVRNLTMNLHITNMFKADDGNHLEKIKRKLTDVIVDAARDGMVTIGV